MLHKETFPIMQNKLALGNRWFSSIASHNLLKKNMPFHEMGANWIHILWGPYSKVPKEMSSGIQKPEQCFNLL